MPQQAFLPLVIMWLPAPPRPRPMWSSAGCFPAAKLPWLPPPPPVAFPDPWASRWPLPTAPALLGQAHTQPCPPPLTRVPSQPCPQFLLPLAGGPAPAGSAASQAERCWLATDGKVCRGTNCRDSGP